MQNGALALITLATACMRHRKTLPPIIDERLLLTASPADHCACLVNHVNQFVREAAFPKPRLRLREPVRLKLSSDFSSSSRRLPRK